MGDDLGGLDGGLGDGGLGDGGLGDGSGSDERPLAPALESLTEAQLAALARRVVDQLAQRGSVGAFQTLVDLSAYVGASLGESARLLAEQGSWSQVAEITGTSKQAAWSRWH